MLSKPDPRRLLNALAVLRDSRRKRPSRTGARHRLYEAARIFTAAYDLVVEDQDDATLNVLFDDARQTLEDFARDYARAVRRAKAARRGERKA